MSYDGLWDVFTTQAMGELTEACNAELGISREEQDAFSARSHQRAAEAWKNGLFDDEVVPVEIPQRKGDPVVVQGRRGHPPRHDRRERWPSCARRSRKDGTITAGSSSQISDGAAAVVVMSKAKAEELGLTWLAEIGAHGVVAGPDSTLQSQPSARDRQGLRARRASARPTSTWSRSTRRSPASASSRCATSASTEDKVNVNGGAIALGHPIGMSGARIALHLALELQRRGGGVGAAALCGGGGQGDALVLRVPGRRLTPRWHRRRTSATLVERRPRG